MTVPTPAQTDRDRAEAASDRLRVVRVADRESMWFLGDFVQFLVTGEMTEGRLMVAYHHARADSHPPLHEHDAEDEIFVLIEGQITFWAAGREEVLNAGDTIVLPRDLPHTFRVAPDREARWLVLLTPGGFESFFREVGVPAEYEAPQRGWVMDGPTEARLHAAARRAGISILDPETGAAIAGAGSPR